MDHISQLRKDITSGEWVVIAQNRGKRPQHVEKQVVVAVSRAIKESCPFENLFENAHIVLPKNSAESWAVQVIPNKYPAFGSGVCNSSHDEGPYHWTEGVGFHEVVITRDHDRPIALMKAREVDILVQAYQVRYLELKQEACVDYISIFHNHGPESGASIAHPHSQILTTPVIPPHIGRSLRGSARYFKEHGKCVHCVVIEYELNVRMRIVYENPDFVVMTPYASKTAYELKIFPKSHSAQFENMRSDERHFLADALQSALAKIYHALGNPSLNFFLHTAPVRTNSESDSAEWEHYHWHFEILPKIAVWAGFEIGTGIDISGISPEEAAVELRNI